jgi:hypothetical protein
LLILLLAQCQPTPTPPDDEPFPEPARFDTETLPAGPDIPAVELQPGQALVPGQIVVTGPAADMELIMEPLRAELGLEQLSSRSLDYLERYQPRDLDNDSDTQQQGKRISRGLASLRLQQVSSLRTNLYAFTTATPPLAQTLQRIADEVQAQQGNLEAGVIAEPNYIVGFEMPASLSADPWAVEGSPWAVEGSPWAVEGSTGDETGVEYASDRFWQQWALGEAEGIQLFAGGDLPTGRTVQQTGEGIRIAVFDTSPFPGPGGYRMDRWGPPDFPSLAIRVSEPVVLPASTVGEEVPSISDHGLFVSGLAYAVAPAAEIDLIRILNDNGQGTIQAFVDALHIYLQDTLAERGTLEGTVINLSLGTAEPDEEELPPEARRAIRQMMDLWGYRPLREDGVPVFSLELPMIIAEDLGAVVVAASGNDSAEQPATDPLPSQIPAAYPLVIGVQASNQSMSRSCFANAGDLLAPGGEGGELPQECRPITNTCKPTDATCEAGVISYVLDAHRGFAFWVGTSFATPLVSGLSALVQESGTTEPALVQQTIRCSAQTDGVIDVVDALNRCP